MRLISTSLGAWAGIERGQAVKHGVTFPLAILHAVLTDAGLPEPESWEGDGPPASRGIGEAGEYSSVLISAMDPRHFWEIPPFLRAFGIPVRAADRGLTCPFVVAGGQAMTAPAPVEAFVDVVFVGEAEAGAAELILALEAGRSAGWGRQRILESVAALPGCLVPSHFPAGHVVQQVWATSIDITLRHMVSVNHREIRRVEIARGCKSHCGFCALGWRAPYRENETEAIREALRITRDGGVREIHLSAGDAEGHSGITSLRGAVKDLSLRDHGWTGRLDTMRDCSVSAGKNFAFGIEGLSHRLRRAVGKPRLTDDYIVEEIDAYFKAGGRRVKFHMIGGLPTETDADGGAFASLLDRLAGLVPGGGERYHIDIGRQPFGPLPHTPMQWFAPGLHTRRVGAAVARHVSGQRFAVIDEAGQSAPEAILNTLVMRGGREVTPLIEQGKPRLGGDDRLLLWRAKESMRSRGLDLEKYLREWDPSCPLPWDHVVSAHSRESLSRQFLRIRENLTGRGEMNHG